VCCSRSGILHPRKKNRKNLLWSSMITANLSRTYLESYNSFNNHRLLNRNWEIAVGSALGLWAITSDKAGVLCKTGGQDSINSFPNSQIPVYKAVHWARFCGYKPIWIAYMALQVQPPNLEVLQPASARYGSIWIFEEGSFIWRDSFVRVGKLGFYYMYSNHGLVDTDWPQRYITSIDHWLLISWPKN